MIDELTLEPDHGYLPKSMRPTLDIPRHKREKWHKEAQNLFRPTPNGYNDPMSHLLLLDTLMRLRPNQMIRAASLAGVLSQLRPQLAWDSITVGRIMTELTDMAFEQTPKAEESFMLSAKDKFGTYFVLSETPKAYQWLTSLRESASEKVSLDLSGARRSHRSMSIWAP